MENTKFQHLRFLSGKMWFIFGTNCLFDGITIFKFEAKLCFGPEMLRCVDVLFVFILFVFVSGEDSWYIFSSSRLYVCCGESVDSCSHRFCHLFAVCLVRCVYLFICVHYTNILSSSTYLFFALFTISLSISLSITLSIAFSFIRRNIRTPTESLFIFYSLISCHSSVTSFFSWLCHNLCWIFLFSSLCRSIYIFLIVIFRQMTTGCVLCWLKIVEFN